MEDKNTKNELMEGFSITAEMASFMSAIFIVTREELEKKGYDINNPNGYDYDSMKNVILNDNGMTIDDCLCGMIDAFNLSKDEKKNIVNIFVDAIFVGINENINELKKENEVGQ